MRTNMNKILYVTLAVLLSVPALAYWQDGPASVEDRNIMVKRDAGESAPLHVFAGTQITVPVVIYAPAGSGLDIEAELVQTAASAAVSQGEAVHVFSGTIPEGEGFVRREVSVSLPKVRRKATFELRFFRKDEQEAKRSFAGKAVLAVYPDDLMEPVKEWAESGRLRLDDKQGILKQFLTDKEVAFKDSKAVSLKDATLPKVTFKTGAFGRFEEPEISSGEILVLFQPKEDFPLIIAQKSGDGTLIDVKMDLIGRLHSDPTAQLTLLEIFQIIQNQ